jgi:hypothetical protein
MPSIGNRTPGINPNLNVGGTQTTTAPTTTTTVGGVQNNPVTTPQTPVVGNPNASGASAAGVAREAKGMPAGFDIANILGGGGVSWNPGVSGANDGMTGGYIARPSATNFIAYGDITSVKPTQDGFQVKAQLFAQKETDEVALFLQLPVLDKKSGALTYLNLDLLTSGAGGSTPFTDKVTTNKGKDPISGKACFTGERTYTFSLKQINDFIKSNGIDLVVKPGDQMSISGIIKGDGHRIMNAASNAFTIPKPTVHAPQNPLAGRIGNMTGQTTIKAEDMPLDMSIKLPQSLLDERIYVGYGKGTNGNGYIKVGDILEGDITTRLESEYKGSVNASQMDSMITNAYSLAELSDKALAGDAAARKKLDGLLGPDLVLSPVKRHWMCSDGEPLGNRDPNNLGVDKNGQAITLKTDSQGWPSLDPMKDGYSDDKNLTFSKESGAARVRGNAQKQGHAEFKIGGGVLDTKTGIRQRVETGLSLKPGATEDQLKLILQHIADSPSSKLAQSPLGHLIDEARKGGVLEAMGRDRSPWADVTQIRHKFELKNTKTGTSAELSLDMVNAKTMRKEHEVGGAAQEQNYYVIETELDHLQINSSNVTELQESKTKAALTSTAAQETWLKQTATKQGAGQVDLEVLTKPQLHSNDHVVEGSFRQTGSYKDFEKMQDHLLAAICNGFKPGAARQKSAHFAELLGLIPPEKTVTV